MVEFEPIKSEDKVEDILKGSLGLELPVRGGWGYCKDKALIIKENFMPIEQLQFMFAMGRATIVMNLTRTKENRYGGINIKELSREVLEEEGETFYKVTYEVTGMLEEIYAKFIDEYKQNHGNENFDLNDHFKRREENTLKIEETIWFKKEREC